MAGVRGWTGPHGHAQCLLEAVVGQIRLAVNCRLEPHNCRSSATRPQVAVGVPGVTGFRWHGGPVEASVGLAAAGPLSPSDKGGPFTWRRVGRGLGSVFTRSQLKVVKAHHRSMCLRLNLFAVTSQVLSVHTFLLY